MENSDSYLVFGSGGIIGSAICKSLEPKSIPITKIDWHSPEKFMVSAREILKTVTNKLPETLHVIWAAGSTNIQSATNTIKNENEIFLLFLKLIGDIKIKSLSIVSSAGAIYSSDEKRANESSKISLTTEYAKAKIHQETLVKEVANHSDIKVRIARLSSVYGLRRDFKSQLGVISNLIQANVNRKPTEIYVPLDIKRNFIHASTAAEKLKRFITSDLDSNPLMIKNICAQNSTSIREIISIIDKVSRRKTPFTLHFDSKLGNYKSSFIESIIMPNIDYAVKDNLHGNIANMYRDLVNLKIRCGL